MEIYSSLKTPPSVSSHVSPTEIPLGGALRSSNRHKKESIGPVHTWITSYSTSQYRFSKPSGQDIKLCSFSIMLQTTRLCTGCLSCSQHEPILWRQPNYNMRDGWNPLTQQPQPMYTWVRGRKVAKGMRKVLEERGLWRPGKTLKPDTPYFSTRTDIDRSLSPMSN